MARVKNIKSNFSINIGKKIAEQRLALGMSRSEVAKPLGITHQQLAKYETAENRISAEMIFEIAKVLKLPLLYFFESRGKCTPQSDYLEQMTVYIAKNFRKIKCPQTKELIAKMIAGLAKIK